MALFDLDDRGVMTVTPDSGASIGRSRLEKLRAGASGSSRLDKEIIAFASAARPPPQLLILRARNDDGSVSYGFDNDLSYDESLELGHLMIRGQLDTWRILLRAGITLFVKVEWGAREVNAFEHGMQQVRLEIERDLHGLSHTDEQRAVLELDHWVLKNLSVWLLTSYDNFCRQSLPRMLERTKSRRRTIDRLLRAAGR